jgi:hypothetical protein
MGKRKYRERIHKDAKFSSDNKNLPYSFSKPKKEKATNRHFECSVCQEDLFGTEDTYLIICSKCGHVNKVRERRKADEY